MRWRLLVDPQIQYKIAPNLDSEASELFSGRHFPNKLLSVNSTSPQNVYSLLYPF